MEFVSHDPAKRFFFLDSNNEIKVAKVFETSNL